MYHIGKATENKPFPTGKNLDKFRSQIHCYILLIYLGGLMPVAKQIIGGRMYVYEYKSTWNKERKRSEQKRQYFGRIINDEFVPNKKYLLLEKDKQRELSEAVDKLLQPESRA